MANNTEKRITAKMILDSTGFNSSIQGVNQQLKVAQSELKNASAQVGTFGRDSEKLKSVQEALAKQVELHAQKVDVYKQSIEKTTAKMQDNILERDRFKASLDKANNAYNEAVKLYGKESEQAQKAREEVSKLEKEHKNKEKAVESNAKQINNYTTNMNKANAEMTKAQGELKKVSSELDKSNNKWLNASETLKKSSEKLKSVGSAMSGAGDTILKITAPLVGAGIVSGKFAVDFENGMAKVSTIADESEVNIEDLRKAILDLSNDTGIAATEIANNTYDAISAGQKTGDAVNFVVNSTKLAKAGFAEAGDALDVLTTILNAYKLESKEVANVSDVLIQVQNLGKVTVGELAGVMGKVIPTAVATNTSLVQVGTGYALMTSQGVKAAETTTYMNSLLNELSKTGSKTDKALREVSGQSFSELMANGSNLSDVLNVLNDYANKNNLSLKDMFGSIEAGKASLILAQNAGADFNEMLKEVGSSAGSTDIAFNKVTNTTGERLTRSLNKLKNEAIRFGDAIIPMIDRGTELIGKLTDRIGKMDDKQLKTIANIGLFTVALGGVLKVGGGVVGSVGSIAAGLSKLSAVMGTASAATTGVATASSVAAGTAGVGGLAGLGTALGGVAIAAAPWILAGAAVAGTGYLIYKGVTEEAIPAIDLFADKVEYTTAKVGGSADMMGYAYETTVTKISEGTEKAVGAYIKLDDEATKSLTNLYVNATTITTDTANNLTGRYNEMANTIKTRMDEHYNDQYNVMDTFFKNSGALSDAEEAEALEKLKKNNAEKKEEIDKYTKQIQTILKKASDEKRALTLEEQQRINDIQIKMKENAVKTLSESEIESKIILERLKDYSTRITAEQAAETIANAEKQRKESVANAEKQYDETVKNIIKMRDETGAVTGEQADKLIADAKRQKEESIAKAGEMKDAVVDRIKEMNSEIIKDIDTSDGHIKTRWDKLKDWFANNPIIRWIKTMTSGDVGGGDVGSNWTGTNYWRGGLTTLHERGYELYDLPRATRVYNHEASEQLVIKTAESVAEKVASRMLGNMQGNNGINVTQNIYTPTSSPSEMARQTKNNLRELALCW